MIVARSLCFIACCTMAVPTIGWANPIDSELTLNYGVISTKPKKRIKDSYPIMSNLAKQLSHYGYTDAEVKVYATIDELVAAFQTGEVDIMSATIYPTLILNQRAQTQPILVRWKKGDPSYSSVFVTHKKNGYQDLSELQGKVVGFEDRDSTSGYFLPLVTLLSQGLDVQLLTSINEKPSADKVGYFFFEDFLLDTNEVNMSMWATKGIVDAIAYSSSNWDNPKDTPVALKHQLRTFGQTSEYPRAVISVSQKLPAETVADIKQALLSIDQNEEGQALLKTYQKTKKFTLFDSQSEALFYQAADLLNKFEVVQ
ncbi:phosphate/phosphite/phosphonate ABC transporter substrate-binding protein [Vibrio sinaloensis]|uniref:phosphate/phosphite/phosphonate ABC transporter substrate-binding protein n=1 Tax=Photobacterium sp. (strain ATCC 43367) TaxID=379097 RepID=UPI0035E70AFC